MTNCINFTVEGLLECHKNASLSDPWPHSDAYIIFMHCMSVVTLGLFLFAAYCIQYKTINEAKFFARLQLVHLLWTTSTDLLLTSICTPIIFVPYYAGYFNGILSLLGMDPFLQTCLCLCSLISSSILHLLWFKCYIVLPMGHWLRKERLFTRGLFLLYPLWLLFSAWCYSFMSAGMEEQWIGSLQRMVATPSQLYDHHKPTVFLVARREQSNSFKFINVAIGTGSQNPLKILVLYVILCFVAYFWTRHLINKLPASSEKTKKMQKKANRALGLQVSVFLLLFSVPMVVFYFSGKVTENPLPGLSYFMFFIIFMASISDTSTMIGLNEGYRTTFLEKTRLDRFFKKKQLLVAPISNASSIPTDSP